MKLQWKEKGGLTAEGSGPGYERRRTLLGGFSRATAVRSMGPEARRGRMFVLNRLTSLWEGDKSVVRV